MSATNLLHFGVYTPYERPIMTVGSQHSYKLAPKRDSMNMKLAAAQKCGRHTDVIFTFSESTEEIPAHKLILALSSSVFDTMFYGNVWKTGDSVEIVDIGPFVFKMFIEFLYTSVLPKQISISDAIQIIYAARKYGVVDLESTLKQYLNDSITLETVIPILKISIMLDFSDVESKCWECIEMDTDRLVGTKEFVSLDLKTLQKLLERDCLTIPEVKLFDAVIRWAEAECKRQEIESNASNLQSVLGETVRKIRFPVMDATEFADGPATSGVLTQEEISNALLTKFSRRKFSPQMFSPKKRVPKTSLSRLECKCRASKSTCLFCQDRDTSDAATSGTTPRAGLVLTPTCYCCCRTRNYCPSRRII